MEKVSPLIWRSSFDQWPLRSGVLEPDAETRHGLCCTCRQIIHSHGLNHPHLCLLAFSCNCLKMQSTVVICFIILMHKRRTNVWFIIVAEVETLGGDSVRQWDEREKGKVNDDVATWIQSHPCSLASRRFHRSSHVLKCTRQSVSQRLSDTMRLLQRGIIKAGMLRGDVSSASSPWCKLSCQPFRRRQSVKNTIL